MQTITSNSTILRSGLIEKHIDKNSLLFEVP